MFVTREAIERSLADAKMSPARVKELATRVKHCVLLDGHAVDDEAVIPIGGTKIGGRPDMPAGASWPMRPSYPDAAQRIAERSAIMGRVGTEIAAEMMDDIASVATAEPLSFIAQINLAEVRQTNSIDIDIPAEGRISFFYDEEQQPWGSQRSDAVGWKVVYDNSRSDELVRLAPPLVSRKSRPLVFPPLRCDCRGAMSLYPPHGFDDPFTGHNDPDAEYYSEWYFDTMEAGAESGHQVGGHPHQIQGDMQMECQLVSQGMYFGSLGAWQKAEAERLASDWVLLLQIGSDDAAGFMWGDAGYLYVWIRYQDLRDRRFDKAWVILQCF